MPLNTGMERVERMLTLVPWLSSNPGVSMTETARNFGISIDQLEKDLWTLVVSGLPGHGPDQLIDIDFWDDGQIYVRDPQVLNTSMRLSADESTALLVGLRLLAQISDGDIRSVVLAAAGRIEAAVGTVDFGLVVDVNSVSTIRAHLESMVGGGSAAMITYAGATADVVSERIIWPHHIYTIDDILYVEAYCELAEANRTFRLERIVTLEEVRKASPAGAGKDPHPVGVVNRTAENAATITFSPLVAWAADLHPVRSREVSADGSVTITLGYFDPAWLVGWVMSLGAGAVILAPPDLRQATCEAADRALQAIKTWRA
jgi:proteasome accessory factor C